MLCRQARRCYRIKSMDLQTHSMTAAVPGNTVKGTPCIMHDSA
jgi:hypothetical protein